MFVKKNELPVMRALFSLLIVLSAIFPVAAYDYTPEIMEIARLRAEADSLHSIGRTDTAAIVGAEAIRLAEESGDATQIVGTHAAQGVFLRSLGRIDEALESYGTALEIVTSGQFRENPDQEAIEEIASLYINLAVLNLDMQSKADAAKNAVFSGEWCEKSDDEEFKSAVFGVIGSVLTGCGELEKAMKYQGLAYESALKADDKISAFRSAAYTMLTLDRMGDKSKAEEWRQKCISLLPDIDSSMALLVYYQAECSICLKNDDRKGALAWFNKILNTEGIDNLPFVKFDCYHNMHIAYAGLGDYENAYSTLLKGNELRDSLWEEEKAASLRDLTVKYETKEMELALAKSEARRATTLLWLFAALGILLVGVVIFILYVNRQRRRRMQKEIEFANLRADIGRQLTQQYVEGLENERRRMSLELHDGICNDLLAIQMNISKGKSPEEVAKLIDTCRESVRRISHELMPPEFAYADLDEVVRFFVAKQAEANKGRIDITYTSFVKGGDWMQIPDNVSLDVYRIIQEAVSNSIKHSGADEIKVSMELEGPILRVAVADNGNYKPSGKRGLGIESIKRRSNAVNGSVVIRNDGAGTEILLTVKI